MLRTRFAGALVTAVTVAALTGCGANDDPLSTGDSGGGSAATSTITVGSANFAESELLAEIYAQALEAKQVQVKRQFNIGARELYLKALQDGSINLLTEYNGALLSAPAPGGAPEGVSSPTDVLAALKKVLPAGTEVLEQSAAEDKDTLSITQETATKYSLKTIDDLKPVAGKLTIGAGPGPKNLYLAENVLPLIRSEADNPTVSGALNAVSAKLTTENLTTYLAEVQVDKQDTAAVAKAFLIDNGLV